MAGPRVSRKATKGKGKRWQKGQSCVTNPEKSKYRDAAKSRFFQYESAGKSALTVNALKVHDAQAADNYDDDKLRIDDHDDVESIGAKTFCTFATNWTTCTNPSFERFLQMWKPNSAVHKDRLAILAAVTEIIKAEGGKETEVEYFAALVTTLDSIDNIELLAACINLIGMVMKRLSSNILVAKFSQVAKIFLELLIKHAEGESPSLAQGLIGCLSVMLRAQDAATWTNSSTMQIYQTILAFVTHSKPKIRKAAQHAVCSILKGTTLMLTADAPAHHPAALTTAKHCIKHMEENGGAGDVTATLHMLNLLKNILAVFPPHSLKTCCETVLKLMVLADSMVTSSCFQVLHGLFVNNPSVRNVSADLNAQLINALYDFQPSSSDTRPLVAWLTVLKAAHCNLLKLDGELCLTHLAHSFSVITKCWLSPKPEVCAAVTSVLKSLLYECGSELSDNIGQSVKSGAPNNPGQKMFQCIEACLGYQHNSIWNQVLHVLAVFFETLGKVCAPFMRKCLKSLADLRSSSHFSNVNELDYAIGMAVRSIGPEMVLKCIPLDLDQDCPSLEKSWMVPILRDNIRSTRLGYFVQYFYPLAENMKKKAQLMRQDGKIASSKTYFLLHDQIWSLLPGFCTTPTDLTVSFKDLAKTLGVMLSNKSEVTMEVLSSIRTLISGNLNNEVNRKELAKFAKNYLPIFFNAYSAPFSAEAPRNDGVHLAIFETAKVYLQIAGTQECNNLFDKALAKAENEETDNYVGCTIIDLMRILSPYIDGVRLEKLYQFCLPLLTEKNHSVQKKAYRVWELLCGGDSENCQNLVRSKLDSLKENLLDVQSLAAPSSKAPRLRCLSHVINRLTPEDRDFILSLVPEVILSMKENSKRAKLAAEIALVSIAKRLLEFGGKSPEDIIVEIIRLILAGFGGSTYLISASVISLGHIMRYFRDKMRSGSLMIILEGICLLLASESREVALSALDFIKSTVVTFSAVDLAQHVSLIVNCLSGLGTDCRSHFRIKIRRIFERLIGKFGYEMIYKLAPVHYKKLLSLLRKQIARTKRQRAARDVVGDDDDDDADAFSLKGKPQTIDELLQVSDSEEEDGPGSGHSRPKKEKAPPRGSVWIHEGSDNQIIDFLDPKSTSNIHSVRPEPEMPAKPRETKDDFEISADGKMIIPKEDDAQKNKSANGKDSIMRTIAGLTRTKEEPKGQKRKMDDDDYDANDDEDEEDNPRKYRAGGGGIHRPVAASKNNKNKGNKNSGKRHDGSEYKAKRAGGDNKKIGKLDPYAYVPLNAQTLNRRKKAKFAGNFKGIVKAAQKGSRHGKQSNVKQQKHKRKAK